MITNWRLIFFPHVVPLRSVSSGSRGVTEAIATFGTWCRKYPPAFSRAGFFGAR
jgi:hypothetical protein